MSKLTLDALKGRAGAVASTDLLNSISGGLENDCHTEESDPWDGPYVPAPTGEDWRNAIPGF